MKQTKSTWVEISKSSFNQNVSQIKAAIGSHDLAIVVKANAYGHGMQEIASLAMHHPDIDWLCVAFASEALALHAAEISKSILVMNYIDVDLEQLVGTNIHLMIDTYETALLLHKIGKAHQYAFPIHIKIDTGLSRFGISAKDALQFIGKLLQLSHIRIAGVYSHFAESDKQDSTFTNQQINRFKLILDALKKANLAIPHIHFSNSAATTTIDLPFCTLFRVGINAYGLWSSPHVKEKTMERYPSMQLQPILTWKSRIIGIKQISAGEFVGYSRAFQTARTTQVAIIPVGYYDGYDIRFSNNGAIYCNGQTAPIIGRVAMNAMMVDITDIDRIAIGDEVLLMGPYPGISPYDLGARIQIMNMRELTTKINPYISRIVCR
jgi:alanine racemase